MEYKILIIAEALNTGLRTEVCSFPSEGTAEHALVALDAAPQVDGQLVRGIRLYLREEEMSDFG